MISIREFRLNDVFYEEFTEEEQEIIKSYGIRNFLERALEKGAIEGVQIFEYWEDFMNYLYDLFVNIYEVDEAVMNFVDLNAFFQALVSDGDIGIYRLQYGNAAWLYCYIFIDYVLFEYDCTELHKIVKEIKGEL